MNTMHAPELVLIEPRISRPHRLQTLRDSSLGALVQPALFLLVGLSGMVLDLGCFFSLAMVLPLALARALAIALAVTWNFWWNRRLTFSHARSQPLLPQYVSYCLSCLVGALVNWSVSLGAHRMMGGIAYGTFLAPLVGIACGTVFNYLFSSRWVFKVRPSLLNAGTSPCPVPTEP